MWPGSVHDARIFAHSPVYAKRMDGTLFLSSTVRTIQGDKVPLYLVGDSAYPLMSW